MTQQGTIIEAQDVHGRDLLASLAQKSSITKEDVAALRKSESVSGVLTLDTAAALVAIERGPADKCRARGDFLIETLLDAFVWGERPGGVVTDQQAAWLLAQVGEAPTPACMALLVSVIEEAHTIPTWFGAAVRVRAVEALAGDENDARHAA